MVAKELFCEYVSDPLGVDALRPRFGWVLEAGGRGRLQSAYHVLVARSPEQLSADVGDMFDSGKVNSDQSVNAAYEGRQLESETVYYWKVSCWDETGQPGPWSKPATFEMGLLRPADWEGTWIGGDPSISSPLLRKEITIQKKIKRGRAYISGLGCYELYINGQRVGDHVLEPASTDYDKRILYATYDVTEMLLEGPNAVGVMLGNGFFCQPAEPNLTDRVHCYGDSPRLLMQMNIRLADGNTVKVKTDDTWRVSPGPILFNSVVTGEVYDARLEQPGWNTAGFDDSKWSSAAVKTHPGGVMESQLMPAIKVNKTIKPVGLSQPVPGIYVYDLGQCFGGWVRLRVHGPAGTQVIIKYSEYLEPGGLVEKRPYPDNQETNRYTLRGGGEEIYEPRFTYHPVRYVQIEGYPGEPTLDDLQGRVIYSAVDLYGEFSCSDLLLNRIHQNVEWTLTNQTFGMPLDCLHREKCAPLDPASVAGALYTRKYMPLFWSKWLRDVRLTQKEDGVLTDAAPDYRHLYPAGPHICYPPLVWYFYQCYDDRRILEEHYSAMKAWTDYLSSQAENHLLNLSGLEFCSDHMLPGKNPGEEEFMSKETPGPIIFTGCYLRDVIIVAQAAAVLGRTQDARDYVELAEKIAEAYNREWFNKEKRHYVPDSQTANIFPLALGIVPKGCEAEVKNRIVASVVKEHGGHLHTGTIGTTAMVEALPKYGLAGLLHEIATIRTYPGWGYMVAQGATTIWECWGRFWPNPRWRADSMMMWATIDKLFYHTLAGISEPGFYSPDTIAPGFRRFDIKPCIVDGLEFAGASIKTVRGIISSRWRWENRGLVMEITVPVNSEAKIHIPKLGKERVRIEEDGKVIWNGQGFVVNVSGITGAAEDADRIVLDAGSGSYRFVVTGEGAQGR